MSTQKATMRILGIAGSLREGSYNRSLPARGTRAHARRRRARRARDRHAAVLRR
jgi:NAD(P)H-dependent FMN reductase